MADVELVLFTEIGGFPGGEFPFSASVTSVGNRRCYCLNIKSVLTNCTFKTAIVAAIAEVFKGCEAFTCFLENHVLSGDAVGEWYFSIKIFAVW